MAFGTLTCPAGFFPSRNFRKHLRMVGSRRVKAQSKTWGWVGTHGAVLASGGLGLLLAAL